MAHEKKKGGDESRGRRQGGRVGAWSRKGWKHTAALRRGGSRVFVSMVDHGKGDGVGLVSSQVRVPPLTLRPGEKGRARVRATRAAAAVRRRRG